MFKFLPEGNHDFYARDPRCNLTQTTSTAKNGSGLADIVTSAGYDTVCANPVTCNKPNWKRDADSNQTDYTYDPVHGGVLSVTAPAAANGVRPQTRYSYSQIPSYAKNSTGVLVQSGLIWSLTGVSTCATGAAPTCIGTSDEITTTISYAGSLNGLATQVVKDSGALQATTAVTYDNIGNVLTTTDATGAVTRLRYDAERQLVGVVGPDPDGAGPLKNRATRYTYNFDGLQTLVEQGTVTGQSDSNWNAFVALAQTATAYDAIDRKALVRGVSSGATQSVTQFAYDAANRQTCVASRMNPAVFAAPPASACTLGAAGPNGSDRITAFNYDVADRVTQVIEAYGVTGLQRNERTQTYTPNGALFTIADAKGNLTTNVYDGFDRLSTIWYPNPSNGSVSSTTDHEGYAYDPNGNVTADGRRDGQVAGFSYDALNRLVSETLPAPTAYTYDNLGRLTLVTRGDQGLSYTYDALDHRRSEYGAYGQFNFQYDLAGALTQIAWPDGFYVNYGYDFVHEMTSIRENGAASGVGVLAQYTYNDLGLRTQVNRGNGVVTNYGYDTAWRLGSLSHTLPATGGNQTLTFGYTAANEIASRISSNPQYNWQGPAPATRGYTLDGQNRVTQSGGNAIGYDGQSNLNSDGVNSYSYDTYNHLYAFNSTATLRGDPLDRLMAVTDLANGVATTDSRWFRYYGSRLLAEYGDLVGQNNGVLYQRHVPGPGVDETVVSYAGSDTTNRQWLLADERGSTIAVTNASGTATTIDTYDEYGVPGGGNVGTGIKGTGTIATPSSLTGC